MCGGVEGAHPPPKKKKDIGYLKEVVDSLCPRRISVSSDDSDSSSQSTMRASPVNPDDVTVVTTNATAYVL